MKGPSAPGDHPEKPGSMEEVLGRHWHQVPEADAVALLGTSTEKGLDLFEVNRRRERFGPNTVPERKGRSPLARFLLQIHQPLVYVLLISGGVTLFFKEVVDALVILGVVLVNAVVGYYQEGKALRAIEALRKSMTSFAAVLRSGRREKISSEDLVPGDIVFLGSGDKVPADLRLIGVRDLQVNESALTGEPVPAQKAAGALPEEAPLADRRNMAYSSTIVTYGTGTGVVVATGSGTEIGRISELIASVDALETPLTRKIGKFSRVLLAAILVLSGLAFVVGILRDEPPVEMFHAATALAVGAIPEGLPAAVTIIMAAGVFRMARRNAIIRRLPAVETLGSTTVICSDKTGTLTRNQMTVQEVLAGGGRFEVTGTGYAPRGEIRRGGSPVDPGAFPALRECLAAGLLCNDSEISEKDGLWTVQGDPTEGALVSAARKGGLDREALSKELPRLDAIPFESQHQYMVSLHDAGPGRPRIAWMKGSAEVVLARCRAALGPGGEVPLDAEAVRREIDGLAERGLRVLAFARKDLPSGAATVKHEDVGEGLVFLGLQAMIDPPRPEAARAVAACRRAGIRVKMITGDHAVTAGAIARELGIEEARSLPALTSRDLEKLSDEGLIEAAERTAVFARVSPEQKLRLVEALQARGHVVAMTGDGVNDAPALRRADIGVAMALGGTEAAREAADMVLTDDNFASIEAAVEEGRGVFDNLQKFIIWTLPTNGGQAMVLLLGIVLGTVLPIVPVQVLWINMMTALCLGMTLAFEPKETGIMDRPPNTPGAPLLTGILLWRILSVSVLLCGGVFAIFEWEIHRQASPEEARTAAVATIVLGQLFYLFNCRSHTRSFIQVGLFSNVWIWAGAASMVLLQLLFTYLPILNAAFHSRPIDAFAWVWIVAVGLAISAAVSVEKEFWRRFARGGRSSPGGPGRASQDPPPVV